MKEKTIKVTLEKAQKWYTGRNKTLKELALQAFTEEELKDALPKTWKEFCKYNNVKELECFIAFDSTIKHTPAQSHLKVHRDSNEDRNLLVTEESAKAHLALMQLEQLRDCYRNGWVPDWTDARTSKYTIYSVNGRLEKHGVYQERRFISFQTQELRDKFLNNFKDLIEEAKDLI